MATSTQTYEVDVTEAEYPRHHDTRILARLIKTRGSGPFPIMVELHGGAWDRGNREELEDSAILVRVMPGCFSTSDGPARSRLAAIIEPEAYPPVE